MSSNGSKEQRGATKGTWKQVAYTIRFHEQTSEHENARAVKKICWSDGERTVRCKNPCSWRVLGLLASLCLSQSDASATLVALDMGVCAKHSTCAPCIIWSTTSHVFVHSSSVRAVTFVSQFRFSASWFSLRALDGKLRISHCGLQVPLAGHTTV